MNLREFCDGIDQAYQEFREDMVAAREKFMSRVACINASFQGEDMPDTSNLETLRRSRDI